MPVITISRQFGALTARNGRGFECDVGEHVVEIAVFGIDDFLHLGELIVAEALMSKHKKSRIICLDQDDGLAGVISLSDVARVETGARSAALLRSVAQREARP